MRKFLAGSGVALCLLASACVHQFTAADFTRQAAREQQLAAQAEAAGDHNTADTHRRRARQLEWRAEQRGAEEVYFGNDNGRQVFNAQQGPVPSNLPPP